MMRLIVITLALALLGSIEIQAEPFNNKLADPQKQVTIDFEIEGNTVYSDQELIDEMGLDSLFKHTGNSSSKKLSDLQKIDEAVSNLRFFLADNGYLSSFVGVRKLEYSSAGLKVKITVEEGIRYRFGRVKVEGSTVFAPEVIVEFSGIKTGEIATAETVREGVFQRVREAYANMGYLQASAWLEKTLLPAPPNALEGIADLTINIDEGKPFVFRRIEFSGNKITRDRILRRQLLFNEGDLYNEELVERTVERLNQLGLFKKIRPSDVRFKTDEKNGVVDITIILREKSK